MDLKVQPVLRFGIASLDKLFGQGDTTNPGMGFKNGQDEQGRESFARTSLCIIGPDGTGKSVLALHLASHYIADSFEWLRTRAESPIDEAALRQRIPKIIYASTDLSYARAYRTWARFGLARPQARCGHLPFQQCRELCETYPGMIDLSSMDPHIPERIHGGGAHPLDLGGYLQPSADLANPTVAFLNLESATAGDDWGYLNRVTAVLPKTEDWPHMLIIDAVEGLEMMVGDHDSFGQSRSRRSRIAQLIRAASGKCHIVFLVEQPKMGERLPEEFVTDFVVHLRSEFEHEYSSRTVEVTKARGQQHVRGRHVYTLRAGKGSFTGHEENHDDPIVRHPLAADQEPAHQLSPDEAREFQHLLAHEIPATAVVRRGDRVTSASDTTTVRLMSYVHVFHSLFLVARERGQEFPLGTQRAANGIVGFGIRHLDSMLGNRHAASRPVDFETATTTEDGLPAGEMIALIGDRGTHKGRLARAFLSQALMRERHFKSGNDPKAETEPRKGIAMLLTLESHDRDWIFDRLNDHCDQKLRKNEHLNQIICRRLDASHTTSSLFLHIIRSLISEGKNRYRRKNGLPDDLSPIPNGDVRLVITDWSALMATYPSLRNDPLLLPNLHELLKDEGVSTLIVATQRGELESDADSDSDLTLRRMTPYQIHTWLTPFFGERRVAISAVPARSKISPTLVRELRAIHKSDGSGLTDAVEVDPHFDLYSGFEEKGKNPSLVPLEVVHYAQSEAASKYYDDTNEFLGQLFLPVKGEPRVVKTVSHFGYENLRDAVLLKRATRMDHTLVFQVDEFWARDSQENVLQTTDGYLFSDPLFEVRQEDTGKKVTADEVVDPYQVWQPIARTLNEPNRAAQFSPKGYAIEPGGWDRVPYMWDFGFMLLKRKEWEWASQRRLTGERAKTVGDVFEALTDEDADGGQISWREFFEACHIVAETCDDARAIPFDVDMPSAESFSCLALEILASEKYRTLSMREPDSKGAFARGISHRTATSNSVWDLPTPGLFEWISMPSIKDPGLGFVKGGLAVDYYKLMMLLRLGVTPSLLSTDNHGFDLPSRPASDSAVAVRHWYSTASRIASDPAYRDTYVMGRLPGHFSVRGDWFLAIASGSRSQRLGERAIDILSSRRGNLDRLQSGLGLPTRIFDDELPAGTLRTALHKGLARSYSYDQIVKFGAHSGDEKAPFFWLWRSQLNHYGRHMRVWQKWLYRGLPWFDRKTNKENVALSFATFDEYFAQEDPHAQTAPYQNMPIEEQVEFLKHCQVLTNMLRAMTLTETQDWA